jgi:peptidoglycan/LPS O-acetylase OafA/YrhL
MLWASFAFINNTLPFAGCASHTWSMAVQMQFYLLLPAVLVLLQPRSASFRCLQRGCYSG